jgi:hypothetical protein
MLNSTSASSNLYRRPLNLRHVIMLDSVCVAVIPRDSDSTPKLKMPPPWERPLEPIYERLGALRSIDWPDPESDAEDWIFAMSALMFVEPTKSERALEVLRQALGAKRLEYLLALLAFIRTAHYWTMVHPELEIEHDASELMALNAELASLLLQGSDLR